VIIEEGPRTCTFLALKREEEATSQVWVAHRKKNKEMIISWSLQKGLQPC
jgi:hypothetical protein